MFHSHRKWCYIERYSIIFQLCVFPFILHDKFYMPKKFKDQMYIGTICMSPSMVYLLIYE